MKVYLKDKDGNCHPVEDLFIAVQSKVLRSRFKYNSSEVVNLPSIEGHVLEKIVAWLYRPQPETLHLDNSEGFYVCDLLVASEFLDMPVLSRQIIAWLEKQLDSGNALDLWIFSKQFLIAELEDGPYWSDVKAQFGTVREPEQEREPEPSVSGSREPQPEDDSSDDSDDDSDDWIYLNDVISAKSENGA